MCMKKWARAAFIMALLTTVSAVSAEQEVVLYNWAQYMDPAILEDFHRETGIRVVEIHYESDQTKDDLLALNGGAGMDLMITSSVTLPVYASVGWIQPWGEMENWQHVDSRWYESLPPEHQRLGVPLLWGTVGILYRKDRVDRPDSWLALFRPRDKLAGKIMLTDDVKDVFGLALKALGFSLNSTDYEENQQAAELLGVLARSRPVFGYPVLNAHNALSRGQVLMAMIYNGDAITLQDEDDRLAFVVPREGTNLWLDSIALFRDAPHPEVARTFVEYLLRPDVAARLSTYLSFATANRDALPLLPDTLRNNDIVYPPDDVMARSEMFRPLPDSVMRMRQMYFSKIRTNDQGG
ncbi:MAG: spermidine/putrescine ABC transporter substrate-binding protein [Gammaproteobacteria bacterium]|nr:MAG: spermidine/putrescine ABC transporter substrate-binding protein [Gammaproteobacteria bacterium]